jgi:hypothetical protein
MGAKKTRDRCDIAVPVVSGCAVPIAPTRQTPAGALTYRFDRLGVRVPT